MKRVLSLIVVVLMTACMTLSLAAGAAGVSPDGTVQEDDLLINIPLTTTLIISICSALTLAIIAAVIVLARRNRSSSKP